MSEEQEEWVVEDQIRSLEAEFWALKRKAREEVDSWKKANMYSRGAIAAGLAMTDYDLHQAFRNAIGERMDKQDPDIDDASNWLDKGWGFENWEEASSEKRLDAFHLILADVQAFLVKEGLIAASEETLEGLFEGALLERVKRNLMKEAIRDDGED